jgi:hypothetical protein
MSRIAYRADESYVNNDGQFMVIEVVENEAGYVPTEYAYESVIVAKATAETMNAANGITHEDAMDIVASSMRASNLGR